MKWGNSQKVIVRGSCPSETLAALKIPTMSLEEFLSAPEADLDVEVQPWDAQSIIYTSGTTGLSKGAIGPHKFWIVVAERLLEIREGTAEDVFYTFLPLYHFNAQVLTVLSAMIAGAQMVLADKFSASGFWDEIRKYGATQFNYLGAVMPILAKQPERPDDADNPARIALGAGCPPGVMEEVEATFRHHLHGGLWDDRDRHPHPRAARRPQARIVRQATWISTTSDSSTTKIKRYLRARTGRSSSVLWSPSP